MKLINEKNVEGSSQNYPDVYLNRIETANPAYDGHQAFLDFLPRLIEDEKTLKLVKRLAAKCQIEHRYSVLAPGKNCESLDADGFYVPGKFASTQKRMERYREEALQLAIGPVEKILRNENKSDITHLIVTSCTGFYAPGIDLQLQRHFGLRSDLERSIIGFMGCYAAFNAMKAAAHIVRANAKAKVLVLNLEICSLHLQDGSDPEKILGFLQFADGCAASLISAEAEGLRLDRFQSEVFPENSDLIRWDIRDQGFDMVLSPDVPNALGRAMPEVINRIISEKERREIELWAIHPGGRSILDAVQDKLQISDQKMLHSREVLRQFGNMSSATVVFVLKSILANPQSHGAGLAMAFGPGLTVESMLFHKRMM